MESSVFNKQLLELPHLLTTAQIITSLAHVKQAI